MKQHFELQHGLKHRKHGNVLQLREKRSSMSGFVMKLGGRNTITHHVKLVDRDSEIVIRTIVRYFCRLKRNCDNRFE